MGRRILYLSQWCWPEPANQAIKVARALKDRGYKVEILTGFPNYPSGKLALGYKLSLYQKEEIEGVAVHRVFLHPSHDRSSLGRAVNYISFFFSALVFCLFNIGRFDLIYVYHPPITTGLAAALAGLVRRKPFVLEVQDLWPDSVAASGMAATGILARILSPICKFVYRRAALVLGQSKGMAQRLVERGAPPNRTEVFFNWADEDAARANGYYDIQSLNFDNRFNFVYAGNLGVVQALDVLIEASHSLAEKDPRILLTLIGDGAERARLEDLVFKRGVRNVQILPSVPSSHIGDVLAVADVLVAHLKSDRLFEITIPSKTQFYLAMGRPILIGVGGEAARIVMDAGAGLATPPDDVKAMAQTMLHMANLPQHELRAMGDRGRATYETHFAFTSTMDRIAVHIDRVIAPEYPA